MIQPLSHRFALALVATAATMAACTGDPAVTAGQRFVAGITAVAPGVRTLGAAPTTLAATTTPISDDQLFAWAQLAYPELFPGVPASFSGVAYQGKVFAGRAYGNGNYLAVANGEAFGLGPFTNQELVNFGAVQGYAATVCTRVDCGRTAEANACAPRAGESLRPGARFINVHLLAGQQPASIAQEVTTDTEVIGTASFNGQETIRTSTTQRDAQGLPVGAASTHRFLQGTDGGLIRMVGMETVAAGVSTRTVYTPALANAQFTLQLGESLTQVQAAATSTVGSSAAPVVAHSATTFTFEARERIEVLGRSYDTCRYREVALGTTAPVKVTWAIVGSGVAARTEIRDASGTLVERSELKSGTVNGAPLAPGASTLDAASAQRLVEEYSYILPICSTAGTARPAGMSLGDAARKALQLRQAARSNAPAPGMRALAYTATRPADQLGDCGGRLSFPSYSHVNGVTTATMRWDNYCESDSDTGGSQVLNGSWSFIETARPGSSGPVVVRYEGGTSNGITIVDRDAAGRTLGTQVLTIAGYSSTPGVPGGDPTAAKPDVLQFAELQVRNLGSGKVYRQTDYRADTWLTADGGEQMSLSGRGYRSSGYYDLRTTSPIVTNSDGAYLSGVLTSTGADGSTIVMNVVPGDDLQATMQVGGQVVTGAPACK